MVKSVEYTRPKNRRERKDLTNCLDCEQFLTDENWRGSLRKWRRYVCNSCWTQRQNNYRNADPDRCEKATKHRKLRQESWTIERKEEERRKAYARLLKRKYNISIEEYDEMLKLQNNSCAICKTQEQSGKGCLHLDHCHSSGIVRKLLCSRCNMMLGLARDNIEILKTSIDYLIEYHNIKEKV